MGETPRQEEPEDKWAEYNRLMGEEPFPEKEKPPTTKNAEEILKTNAKTVSKRIEEIKKEYQRLQEISKTRPLTEEEMRQFEEFTGVLGPFSKKKNK